MIDVEEFWESARLMQSACFLKGKRPPAPPVEIVKLGLLLTANCLIVPITAEKDEDGGWMFQLHPDFLNASSRAWAWLWPIKTGYRSYMFNTFHGSTAHWYWQEYYDKCEADFGYEARTECLASEDIVDIAAFSLDFSKCYGRLNEHSAIIGHPVAPECSRDRPVRLFRSVRKWFDGKFGGAVLIGNDWENEDWLRRCDAGIITDDVSHGKYVQKILQRPYAGPKIMVAG